MGDSARFLGAVNIQRPQAKFQEFPAPILIRCDAVISDLSDSLLPVDLRQNPVHLLSFRHSPNATCSSTTL